MTDAKTAMDQFMNKLKNGDFDSIYKALSSIEEKHMFISEYDEINLYEVLTENGCSDAQINQILKMREEKIPLLLHQVIHKTPQELRRIRKTYIEL